MILVKELSGFSGCKIYLYSDEYRGYFVRKISKSIIYNDRLKSQMEKQRKFLELHSTGKISVPKILFSGYTDGLFYFDMEYIRGVSLIELILNSQTEGLEKISHVLKDILKIMSDKTKDEEICLKSKAIEKIEEIKSKIGFLYEIEEIKKRALELPVVKGTLCHGDLTLENIIYDREKDIYYLIDFLDSFVDHYWFDIVKIFQDLEGQWYFMRNPKIDLKLMETKASFVEKRLREHLSDDDYWKHHKVKLSLNFARILPYASNDEEFEMILEKVKFFLKN